MILILKKKNFQEITNWIEQYDMLNNQLHFQHFTLELYPRYPSHARVKSNSWNFEDSLMETVIDSLKRKCLLPAEKSCI